MKEKILDYIQIWENRCYFNGIPDEVPKELEKMNKVPSYKKICIAILNNDYPLKTLGYSPKKSKYYDAYKKIEIEGRKKNKQLILEL